MSADSGWEKVEAMCRDIAVNVAHANTEHEHQGVGHLCRETLIALADVVHDYERHPPTDGTNPSKTDAKRRLDAYLAAELAGRTNEEARRMVRSAVDLANAVQHDAAATRRDAALIAEATTSLVSLIAIIDKRRDLPREALDVLDARVRAHDEALFNRWEEAVNERFLANLLNGTLYNLWCWRKDILRVAEFCEDMVRVESEYLDEPIKSHAKTVLSLLGQVEGFVAEHFYPIGGEDDTARLKLYPQRIEKAKYDGYVKELHALTAAAWEAYLAFRQTIKQRLKM